MTLEHEKPWTHALCVACWPDRHPAEPVPETGRTLRLVPCCFCGNLTGDGIFEREDPALTLCGGEHEHEPEGEEEVPDA